MLDFNSNKTNNQRMVLSPDRTSDIICKLEFSHLQWMKKESLTTSVRCKLPKVIKETFLRTMKQVWNWNITGRTEIMILYWALLFLQILSVEVEIQAPRASNLKKSVYALSFHPVIALTFSQRSLFIFSLPLPHCLSQLIPP